LFFLVSSAVADEVRLTNGDRLTGEIVTMEKDFLTLRTAYAGELKINWQDVICVASERELTVRLKNGEVLMGRPICPGDGTVQIVGVRIGESAEIPLDELDAINPSPPPPAITYKGSVAGGGSISSGNSDDAFANLSADFRARSERHRLTLGGRYNYGETDNEITTRNALGRIKYDFFIKKALYAYAHALFESDDFRDLNLQSAMGAGLGYQIFDTERTSLFSEAGVSYFNKDFDMAEDESYTSARGSVGINYAIVPERVNFFLLHEFYQSLEDSDEYYFLADQGLRFTLYRNFFASFELIYSYDRQPSPGSKNADTLYIATLGYDFSF
jgi:putative salt-induced outer membrane protein YdiY